MLYKVMGKGHLVNFKMEGETRDALHVAAKLRGLTVSALLHSFAVQVIRDERERNPRAFDDLVAALRAKTSKAPRRIIKQKRRSGNASQDKDH